MRGKIYPSSIVFIHKRLENLRTSGKLARLVSKRERNGRRAIVAEERKRERPGSGRVDTSVIALPDSGHCSAPPLLKSFRLSTLLRFIN